MKVISCNIGKTITIKWRGKDIKTGINKFPVEPGIRLGDTDVEGDHVIDRKYHGGIDQACYLYSKEAYDFWKEKYPNLEWHYGFLGENITIEGLDESKLMVGDTYQLGTAIVEITKPRNPCYKLGVIMGGPETVKAFWDSIYPGAYLKIIKQGDVKAGDDMTIIEESGSVNSILDIYQKKAAIKNPK